jgi:hypothetical protein
MPKPYKPRVYSTLALIRHSLSIINREARTLIKLVSDADKACAGSKYIDSPLPLRFRTDFGDSSLVNFKGFEYSIAKSELTGGKWVQYTDKAADHTMAFFDKNDTVYSTTLPEAYIIPAEWSHIAAIAALHGLTIDTLRKPLVAEVETYRLNNPKWAGRPYEGRFRVEFSLEKVRDTITYPEGTLMVNSRQAQARVLAYLLEPGADGSLAGWGFFNSISEQKEYAEDYVMEKKAREMLEADTALAAEFEMKKTTDSAFAGNPRAMLNWFYSCTPYWDSKKDLYPIGRVINVAIHEAGGKK